MSLYSRGIFFLAVNALHVSFHFHIFHTVQSKPNKICFTFNYMSLCCFFTSIQIYIFFIFSCCRGLHQPILLLRECFINTIKSQELYFMKMIFKKRVWLVLNPPKMPQVAPTMCRTSHHLSLESKDSWF